MSKNYRSFFPFQNPRPGQMEIIEEIITSFENGYKHVILNAPTGSGKSVIAYTIMKYFSEGFIITSQKCLQEQYKADLQIPYIMGRSNYKCSKNNLLTCEFGVCKNNTSKYCGNCPYLKAKEHVLQEDVSDLNYSFFLTYNVNKVFITEDNTTKFDGFYRPLLVLDECHNLESSLIDLCTLKLSSKLLHYLGIFLDVPGTGCDEDDICAWVINKVAPKLREQKNYYYSQLQTYKSFSITKEYKNSVIKYSAITRLLSSIEEIRKQRNLKSKIIVTNKDGIVEIKLLYANNLFSEYVQPSGKYILHMSATVLNKEEYCKSLGIDPNKTKYIRLESSFPEENRIIYYDPVGSMSYSKKVETMPKMIDKVHSLLNQYKDVKGIIHTGNYGIADSIIENLVDTDCGYRLLMPRGNDRQEILNLFYTSNVPYVLVSPSLTEGLDLKDDLSRFCIICKVPYASLADSWTKARMELDSLWYLTNTAQTLIQMTGRSIRSSDDYCDTYILDEEFMSFGSRAASILPDWWKSSVKSVIS